MVLVAGHGRGIEDLVRTDPVDGHDGLAHKLVRAGLTVLCRRCSASAGVAPRPEGALKSQENSCGIDGPEILHGRTLMGRQV